MHLGSSSTTTTTIHTPPDHTSGRSHTTTTTTPVVAVSVTTSTGLPSTQPPPPPRTPLIPSPRMDKFGPMRGIMKSREAASKSPRSNDDSDALAHAEEESTTTERAVSTPGSCRPTLKAVTFDNAVEGGIEVFEGDGFLSAHPNPTSSTPSRREAVVEDDDGDDVFYDGYDYDNAININIHHRNEPALSPDAMAWDDTNPNDSFSLSSSYWAMIGGGRSADGSAAADNQVPATPQSLRKLLGGSLISISPDRSSSSGDNTHNNHNHTAFDPLTPCRDWTETEHSSSTSHGPDDEDSLSPAVSWQEEDHYEDMDNDSNGSNSSNSSNSSRSEYTAALDSSDSIASIDPATLPSSPRKLRDVLEFAEASPTLRVSANTDPPEEISSRDLSSAFARSDSDSEEDNDVVAYEDESKIYSQSSFHSAVTTLSKSPTPPTGASPFTAFRQNSTNIAICETQVYLGKIEELEAQLKESRQQTLLESTKRVERERELADFRREQSRLFQSSTPRPTTTSSTVSTSSSFQPTPRSAAVDTPSGRTTATSATITQPPDTLWHRNKTLVQEIRFADQTCGELSARVTELETALAAAESGTAAERTAKLALQTNLDDAHVELASLKVHLGALVAHSSSDDDDKNRTTTTESSSHREIVAQFKCEQADLQESLEAAHEKIAVLQDEIISQHESSHAAAANDPPTMHDDHTTTLALLEQSRSEVQCLRTQLTRERAAAQANLIRVAEAANRHGQHLIESVTQRMRIMNDRLGGCSADVNELRDALVFEDENGSVGNSTLSDAVPQDSSAVSPSQFNVTFTIASNASCHELEIMEEARVLDLTDDDDAVSDASGPPSSIHADGLSDADDDDGSDVSSLDSRSASSESTDESSDDEDATKHHPNGDNAANFMQHLQWLGSPQQTLLPTAACTSTPVADPPASTDRDSTSDGEDDADSHSSTPSRGDESSVDEEDYDALDKVELVMLLREKSEELRTALQSLEEAETSQTNDADIETRSLEELQSQNEEAMQQLRAMLQKVSTIREDPSVEDSESPLTANTQKENRTPRDSNLVDRVSTLLLQQLPRKENSMRELVDLTTTEMDKLFMECERLRSLGVRQMESIVDYKDKLVDLKAKNLELETVAEQSQQLQNASSYISTNADNRVADAKGKLEDMRSERDSLEQKLNTATDQLQMIEAELTTTKAELDSKVSELEASEDGRRECAAEATKYHNLWSALSTELLEDTQELKEKMTEFCKERDEARMQLSQKAEECAKQSSQLIVAEEKVAVCMDELRDAKDSMQQSMDESMGLRNQNETLATKCMRLREYIRKLTKKCDEWERFHEREAAVLQQLKAANDRTRKKASELEGWLQQKDLMYTVERAKVQDLQQANSDLEGELDIISRELSNVRTQS